MTIASDIQKIVPFLKRVGFKRTEKNAYSNLYCCICLDYQKTGETVIVNNHGGIMEELPTNYYAILGWLLSHHMIPISILNEK